MAMVVMLTNTVRAVVGAGPGSSAHGLYKRIYTPEVGDLVVEQSTSGRSFYKGPTEGVAWSKGFGILLAHREEWWHTDEGWAKAVHEDGEYDRRTDHAWYVQYGPEPADVCRWVNCDFWAIPIDPWENLGMPPSLSDVDPEILARRIGLTDMLVDP